jgi:hypothetical protein
MAARDPHSWRALSDQELLELKLSELRVGIKGSWLERPIAGLYEELEARDLKVQPHFWLSNEWFSPSGVPGIAIPFYLAHPRLKQLERRQMLEVEGASYRECMQILRHEAGHAIDHAFALSRRKRWKEVFGKSSAPYPNTYRPNPTSKRYVMHLPRWYAQSHPDEDFAETFAVWMTPRSRWRARYKGWDALSKLEYVDELMAEIAGEKPKVTKRRRIDPLPKLNMTLRDHYRKKREHYRQSFANIYDHELRKLFATDSRRSQAGIPASTFLRKHRRELRQMVAKWTGEYELTLDHVLQDMITRCRDLRLRAVGAERKLKMDFAILLTAKAVQYVHRNREWHAL